ncbi:helix-turn-helix domain-containing protein [Janibacter sp. LM]
MARADRPGPPEGAGADVFSRMCASRELFQHVTGRWGALVLVALRDNCTAMRFGELRRRVDGISDRMLSHTLTQLERDGVVARTVRSAIPPHVDYTLTPLGQKMSDPLSALIEIIEAELPNVLEARSAHGAGNSTRA